MYGYTAGTDPWTVARAWEELEGGALVAVGTGALRCVPIELYRTTKEALWDLIPEGAGNVGENRGSARADGQYHANHPSAP